MVQKGESSPPSQSPLPGRSFGARSVRRDRPGVLDGDLAARVSRVRLARGKPGRSPATMVRPAVNPRAIARKQWRGAQGGGGMRAGATPERAAVAAC